MNWESECPVMQMLFRNCGQTPAYDVVLFQSAKLAEFPLKTALSFRHDANPQSFGVVGPGVDIHFRLPIDEPLLEHEHKEWIRMGLSALYLFGRITYRDAFGEQWHTDFRVMYKGDVGWDDPEYSLATCENGNGAT